MIQGPQTDVVSYKRVETCLRSENPKSLHSQPQQHKSSLPHASGAAARGPAASASCALGARRQRHLMRCSEGAVAVYKRCSQNITHCSCIYLVSTWLVCIYLEPSNPYLSEEGRSPAYLICQCQPCWSCSFSPLAVYTQAWSRGSIIQRVHDMSSKKLPGKGVFFLFF